MEQQFYKGFYDLVSLDNEIMNKLLITSYKKNMYEIFVEIVAHISDELIMVELLEHDKIIKKPLLDQFMNDDNVDDWIKFKFFCQLESCIDVDPSVNYVV